MDYIKKQKNSKEKKMEESNRRNGSRTNERTRTTFYFEKKSQM